MIKVNLQNTAVQNMLTGQNTLDSVFIDGNSILFIEKPEYLKQLYRDEIKARAIKVNLKVAREEIHKRTQDDRYNNLDEEITSLCEASGLGVCITLNPEAQKLEFEVLEGVDRSANQKDRPPMVFSIDYDNVISREYVSDVSEFKNTAIVAGQGEGADRKITLVGNENTGINRYEMFVDARDIEDESALPDRGKNKLADYTCSDTYSSEVDSAEYQTKWNLGDVVVTIDHEYGVNMICIKRSWDETSTASH